MGALVKLKMIDERSKDPLRVLESNVFIWLVQVESGFSYGWSKIFQYSLFDAVLETTCKYEPREVKLYGNSEEDAWQRKKLLRKKIHRFVLQEFS